MSAYRTAAKWRRINESLRRKGWKFVSMDPQDVLNRALLQAKSGPSPDDIMGFPFGREVS